MSGAVVGQRNVPGDVPKRRAIELKVSDSAADSTRVLDRDLVARGAVFESNLVTSPVGRYAGIEEQRFAAHTKSEYPLEARPIHPSGGACVPRPSAASRVRRRRVNVGARDVRLNLVAMDAGARVRMIDGV